MIISNLDIRNFGRHRKKTFETGGASVVGLLGVNGSGKSTIMSAINYLFTGELSRGDTVKNIVTHGEKFGTLHGDFIKDGKEGSITKTFGSKSNRKLVWDGEEFTKSADVEAKIAEILGASKHALSNACFLKQGTLDSLLFGTDTMRQALFTKLASMEHLAKHKDIVGTRITTLRAEVPDNSQLLDEVKLQLTEAKDALKDHEATLEKFPDNSRVIELVCLIRSEEDRETAIASRVTALQNTVSEYQVSQQQFEQVYKVTAPEQLDTLITTEEQQRDQVQRERDGLAEQINNARAYAQAMENLQKVSADIAASREGVRRAQNRVDNLVAPEDKRPEMRKTLQDLQFETTQLQKWLAAQNEIKENSKDSTCGSCGLKLSADNEISEESLTKLRLTINTKYQEQVAMEKQIQAEDDKHRAFQSKQTDAAINLDTATAIEATRNRDFETAKQALMDVRQWAAIKEADLPSLETYTQQISSIQAKIDTLRVDVTKYRAAVEHLTSTRQSLEKEVQELTAAKELLTTYKAELSGILPEGTTINQLDVEELSRVQDDKKRAEGFVEQGRQAVEQLSARKKQLEDEAAKYKATNLIIKDLEALKSFLSKDGAVQRFIDCQFEILATLTAQNLASFGADFTVEPDPETSLAFIFDRFDGENQVTLPMDKLSGGQKVRLGIAFLLAVQQELVSEVGFQTFDEPSTHLDTDGVDNLCSLFQKLQEILGSTEHQIWVCDHHPRLESAFSKTFNL